MRGAVPLLPQYLFMGKLYVTFKLITKYFLFYFSLSLALSV